MWKIEDSAEPDLVDIWNGTQLIAGRLTSAVAYQIVDDHTAASAAAARISQLEATIKSAEHDLFVASLMGTWNSEREGTMQALETLRAALDAAPPAAPEQEPSGERGREG